MTRLFSVALSLFWTQYVYTTETDRHENLEHISDVLLGAVVKT